ncbi:MAG: hypothetical protein QXR45_08930 [Candidatus Bathyarchaeia archaeon]
MMEKEQKSAPMLVVLVIGSILIIINGILIAFNENQPLILGSYNANDIEDVWVTPYTKHPFWGRIVYGVSGLVEGGLTYGWLSIGVLQTILVLYIFIKPRKIKSLSLWLIILSLLTIPIGGGFYIGLMLSIIIGLYGLEYPKKFDETFIGKMLNALRFNKNFFEKAVANPDLQRAAFTLLFVAVLSGLGSCLYSYNVFKIYPKGDPSMPSMTEASEILIKGRLYSDSIVYILAVSNVFIMAVKWLILTLSIYFFAFKILGKEIELAALSHVLVYVYVPEIILTFMPIIFTNEPNLSQTWSLIIIPISWPLILFYISRLWSFGLLTYTLSKVQDITFGKAVGRALFAVAPYLMVTYLWVYPVFNAPGFHITFTGESSSMIALLLAMFYIIALLVGALRKE